MANAAAAPRLHRVRLARVYDAADDQAPGCRVLVDRLWPRGLTKVEAAVDEWLKDAAPSAELRRWYGHDPGRFDEFARRYRMELRHPPASLAVEHLRELRRLHPLTLLTATRDLEHSAARVLYERLTRRRMPSRRMTVHRAKPRVHHLQATHR